MSTVEEWFDGFWDEHGKIFDPTNIFTSLASRYREGMPCKQSKLFAGSFHICLRVIFEDDLSWIIRVPLPYRVLHRDSHTEREVAVLQFLRAKTTIPVPELIAYGFGDAKHPDLGPFTITKFIRGMPLKDWWEDKNTTRLKQNIEEKIVRKVYKQVADILLELSSLRFSTIGTLSMASGEANAIWPIISPPWTLTQHEAERHHGISPQFADGPFNCTYDWISYISEHHERIIRGVPGPEQNKEIESLQHFREMVPRFVSDSYNQDFRLYCDDFSASNILVDEYNNVVCLGDWEFTYTAPPEYQCSYASWLVLKKPHTWEQEDYDLYRTQLDLFLQVLKEEEEKRGDTKLPAMPSLSDLIRQGQSDGTFWYIMCVRSGLFFEELWERFQKFDPVNFNSLTTLK